MTNNTIKLKAPGVSTRAEMETLVREIAVLKLTEKMLTTALDLKLQAVRDEYEPRLNTLAQELAEKTGAARAWASTNPAEFGARKSIEFVHGLAGFRAGTPKLKTLARWKWERVLKSLRSLRWGAYYLRVKHEINKEQIIADIGSGVLSEADLKKAGAQVVREETFFVEPRLTQLESREVRQAA